MTNTTSSHIICNKSENWEKKNENENDDIPLKTQFCSTLGYLPVLWLNLQLIFNKILINKSKK